MKFRDKLAMVASLAFVVVSVGASPAALPGGVTAKAAGMVSSADLDAEFELEFECLKQDLASRARFDRISSQVFRAESLVVAGDRDPADIVLRRTSALLAHLEATGGAEKLAPLATQLGALLEANRGCGLDQAPKRYALFCDACRLRRQIAFQNPLLKFDQLVFAKHHRSTMDHMCDQYYGITARPGGGLFTLAQPFGAAPQVADILANSTVTRGRLKDRKLDQGSFVTPALSYDGRQLLFAYVECAGTTAHDHHTDPMRGHWNPGRCYHIFKVNLDGSQLEQLTDGTWNDFAPCWLPNGRIAFISERRGGYLRCGRVCPTYTLFDMAADGSDIRCLSFHETNEWHPEVTHDGLIIWTRWDYVDRHGCTAHKPWVITPDGRDPRPLHGNYSKRYQRPDMELDLRPIPGSPRFLATAAPHHGQAYGSIVLVDPWPADDDAMAPVRRLTPEIPFPESESGTESYGTAWPLSEMFYLCVYDPLMGKPVRKSRSPGNYGIYLADGFGNKELLYRDPSIACLNPVPLRPRPMPPVVPNQSERLAANAPAEATVGVVNVYQARPPWPAGTKIKAVRVYQLLPLSVASDAAAHNIGVQIPQGNDSINIARAVLGTVPVEPDGSAYFRVPARRELFFQALDENGLAITSMRFSAQFQPGEQALCQGCHEQRHGAPARPPQSLPLALRRPPTMITPEADGTNPFSYPRLVQPVLDKHCVQCHAEHPGKAPSLNASLKVLQTQGWMNKTTTYYASYVSLAPKFGFYNYGGRGWDDPKWYRTTPGEFGARASKLYPMLQKGHHDLKLPPEDLRRLIVWLDSCSVFYGVYEKEGGQAQLRGELARPTLE